MSLSEQPIDVICQHTADGGIIPIKIKIKDEFGEFQIYRILAYKPLIESGRHVLPNGVCVGNQVWSYECKINVYGCEKRIYLMYNLNNGIWRCQAA